MNSTVSALRAATDDIHQALHHHPVLAPLSGANLDLNSYRRALAGLFGFHRRAVDALSGYPSLADLTTPTPSWLAQDLTALAVDPRQLPLPPPIIVADIDAALGLLYVKEGSLLGGRQLARTIQQQLGSAAPCHHFGGLGAATGAHWQQVLRRVEDAGPPRESMCAAARAAFTHLAQWLTCLEETRLWAPASAPTSGYDR